MNHTPVAPLEDLPVWGDESCITAEGVCLVEDLQEIQKAYSRRTSGSVPDLPQAASLDLWGFDLSQRLNAGELTVENVIEEFRASLDDQDHLRFQRLGQFSLRLERLNADEAWTPIVDTEEGALDDS